jgi:Arc/MetJ-type ribon-helix-helix transcriptional regulator
MRTVVNISLPISLQRVVEDAVENGQYASKSEFFRDLLRAWMEGRLLNSLNKSREEMKSGKGKLLKSLSDLR